jgi:hypothetical protein
MSLHLSGLQIDSDIHRIRVVRCTRVGQDLCHERSKVSQGEPALCGSRRMSRHGRCPLATAAESAAARGRLTGCYATGKGTVVYSVPQWTGEMGRGGNNPDAEGGGGRWEVGETGNLIFHWSTGGNWTAPMGSDPIAYRAGSLSP